MEVRCQARRAKLMFILVYCIVSVQLPGKNADFCLISDRNWNWKFDFCFSLRCCHRSTATGAGISKKVACVMFLNTIFGLCFRRWSWCDSCCKQRVTFHCHWYYELHVLFFIFHVILFIFRSEKWTRWRIVIDGHSGIYAHTQHENDKCLCCFARTNFDFAIGASIGEAKRCDSGTSCRRIQW